MNLQIALWGIIPSLMVPCSADGRIACLQMCWLHGNIEEDVHMQQLSIIYKDVESLVKKIPNWIPEFILSGCLTTSCPSLD